MKQVHFPEPVRTESSTIVDTRTTNLSNALFQTALRNADGRAIVRGERTWSWAHLSERVKSLANTMRADGIGAGSVVLLHSPNCMDYLTVMFAAWRVGAVIVPTNSKLLPGELQPLVNVVNPSLCIVHSTLSNYASVFTEGVIWEIDDDEVDPTFGKRSVIGAIESGALLTDEGEAPVAPGTPAWYFFTSGSSGRPKAAVLTHDQLAFVLTNHHCDLMPDLRPEDATLVLAPLSHGAGVHVLTHISRGAATILPEVNENVMENAWHLIEKHEVTTLFTVPTILNRLVERFNIEKVSRNNLKYVVYAGAPITLKDQKAALDALGPVLVQYYGLCEVPGNITVLPTWMHGFPPDSNGIGTAGFPRTGTTVTIQDSNGVIVPDGTRGEICVCGPAVFPGYLNNDAANSAAFRNGWFRTGDLGYLDPRGFLFITGRASDMFISGGSNVDPREVEESLLRHPDVAQVGIVAAPDPTWGEVGFALCVLQPESNLTDDELIDWCRSNMARYKVPKRVIFVDALPTSAYGKVTTPLLRAKIQELGFWPSLAVD